MPTKLPTTAHDRIHQMTSADFERNFPNEDACKAYLVRRRWPDGNVCCPRCGFEAKAHGTKPFHWQCYNCAPVTSYRFSVLVDTAFENTSKPLRDWFRVIHLMLTSKKGIDALQRFRTLGFCSYDTASYMWQRVRTGLQDREFKQLMGVAEGDETYVRAKGKNNHKGPRERADFGETRRTAKVNVAGAVKRTGQRRRLLIGGADAATLGALPRATSSRTR